MLSGRLAEIVGVVAPMKLADATHGVEVMDTAGLVNTPVNAPLLGSPRNVPVKAPVSSLGALQRPVTL